MILNEPEGPLHGIFFSRKTSCGAALALYNYMRENNITSVTTVDDEIEVSDNIGEFLCYIYPSSDLVDFIENTRYFVQEYMTFYHKIQFV